MKESYVHCRVPSSSWIEFLLLTSLLSLSPFVHVANVLFKLLLDSKLLSFLSQQFAEVRVEEPGNDFFLICFFSHSNRQEKEVL